MGATVAVVLVVLSVLLLTGVIGPGGSGYPHGPLRYSVAAAQVASTTSSYGGGGWRVFAAGGIASPVAIGGAVVTQANFTVPGCNSTVLGSVSPSTIVPAVTGSPTTGIGSAWAFLLVNSHAAAMVAVDINGTVTPLVELSGPSCPVGQIAAFASGVPSGVLDSDAAATVAWQAGGSSFAVAHPNSTVTFSVVSGFSYLGLSTPAEWQILFEACTGAQVGSGLLVPTFNATIDASTGRLLGSSSGTQPCLAGSGVLGGGSPSGTPLGTAFAVGSVNAFATGSGGVGYRLSVASSSGALSWADLAAQMFNATGFPVSGGNLTVTSATGSTVAIFYFGNQSWSGDSASTITSVETMLLYPPASADLSGGLLEFYSTNAQFTGTVATSLP